MRRPGFQAFCRAADDPCNERAAFATRHWAAVYPCNERAAFVISTFAHLMFHSMQVPSSSITYSSSPNSPLCRDSTLPNLNRQLCLVSSCCWAISNFPSMHHISHQFLCYLLLHLCSYNLLVPTLHHGHIPSISSP
jgi:hypothetical protein